MEKYKKEEAPFEAARFLRGVFVERFRAPSWPAALAKLPRDLMRPVYHMAEASMQFLQLDNGPADWERTAAAASVKHRMAVLLEMKFQLVAALKMLEYRYSGDDKAEAVAVRECGGNHINEAKLLLMDAATALCAVVKTGGTDFGVAKANLYSAAYRITCELDRLNDKLSRPAKEVRHG